MGIMDTYLLMVYLKIRTEHCPYLWEFSWSRLFPESGRMDDRGGRAAAPSSLEVAIQGPLADGSVRLCREALARCCEIWVLDSGISSR